MRLKEILSRAWCAAVSLAKEKTVPEELSREHLSVIDGK